MAHVMEILYRNKNAVIEAGKYPSKTAWEALAVTCPEIQKIMQYNTFRTNLSAFMILMALVEADLKQKSDVEPIKQEPDVKPIKTEQPIPKTFQGWTVQRSKKDGFIRLYKSFSGKVKCLYIGRSWDEAKALTKISGVAVEVLADEKKN
jgi:hypothetical protein